MSGLRLNIKKRGMGRSILAVIAGIFSGFIVVFLFERLGHILYPPPSTMDSIEDIEAYIDQAPLGALLLVAFAHLVGTAASVIVAAKIQPEKRIVAKIAGAILLITTLANLFVIPHPVWFAFADALACILGIVLPVYLLNKKMSKEVSN